LSPLLFGVYLDLALKSILNEPLGCRLNGSNVQAIAYADDIALLAPTREGLQRLINVAQDSVTNLGLAFNPTKCEAMLFPGATQLRDVGLLLTVDGAPIKFTSSVRYLGHVVTPCATQNEDARRLRRSIYCSYNTALRPLHRARTTDRTTVFRAHCAHLFGVEVWNRVSATSLRDISHAFDNCMKATLHLHRSTSTTWAALEASVLPFRLQLAVRRLNFWERLRSSDNVCVRAALQSGRDFFMRRAWLSDLEELGTPSTWLPRSKHELQHVCWANVVRRALEYIE
jgi:hypothetical protein